MLKVRILRVAWLVTGLLIIASCATPTSSSFDQYQRAIQTFQEATDTTSSVALKYILELNDFERKLEIDRLRADPDRVLDIPQNFLAPRFEPEAIAVRVRAFDVIKRYTSLLAALADGNAGDRWQSAVNELKGSVDTMISEGAKQYSSALADLSNFVGQNWINQKRSKALDSAIGSAAPAISEISRLIKDDLQTVVMQRVTLINIPLIVIAGEYEAIQKEIPSPARESRRNKKLDELEAALELRDNSLETMQGLMHCMDAFDDAHGALVAYAQSQKGPQDFSDLVVVIDRYSATASALAGAFASN